MEINQLSEQFRLSVGELPGDTQLIAEAIEESLPGLGIPVVLILARKFGGSPLYIRKLNGALLRWRNEQIRSMYDQGGVTGRQLAWFWQLSQSSIEKILAQPGQAGK